ncbi:hypothetical protein L9F63_004181, partial [Diploptera punctata]
GEEFSMVLVLPNERHGLDKMVSQMKPQHLANMLGTRGTKQVYLALPRFKLSSQMSLVPTLKEMGLTDIFSTNSDLSAMTTREGTLSVSNIIHKAELEVNEKGSTASAATAVLVATLSLLDNPDELEFNANHPFLAIIVHRVNSVPLFKIMKQNSNKHDLPTYKIEALLWLATLLLPLTNARMAYEIGTSIAVSTNVFSINFIKELFDKYPENVITSPVSLSSLLAILQQASSGNTRTQLSQILYSGPQATRLGYSQIIHNIKNSNDKATLEFANGAFLRPSLKITKEFETTLKDDFLSEMNKVDFSKNERAAELINSWVNHRTHGRIMQLFAPGSLTEDSKLVLANAMYFKSLWQIPFNENYTITQPFYRQDGSIVQVPMMHFSGALKMGDFDRFNAQWIEIPFQGEKYSMVIVTPFLGVMKFDEMVQNFTVEHLASIFNSLQTLYSADVILALPKFKLSNRLNLIPILQKLGLSDIFTSNSQLPGISTEPVNVNQIVQSAILEVDEQGTAISAAT